MPLSIARITTVSTHERTLSSGVLRHPEDGGFGDIVYVIDIPLPRSFGQIVEQTIIDGIKNDYFSSERKSPIYQFEDCIKQINLALSELAESGQNDWVGHIHAVIALFVNDEIYLSHTGKITGAVIRGQTYSQIFNASQNTTGRVLVHKTFTNLTSGQLSIGDSVILGNIEVGRHFSPQFLCQSTESSPTSAVQSMFQAGRRLCLQHLSAVVVRVEDSDVDVPTEPYTIVLEPNYSGFKKPTTKTDYDKAIAESISGATAKMRQSVWQSLKTAAKKIKDFYTDPKTEIQFDQTENAPEAQPDIGSENYVKSDQKTTHHHYAVNTPKLQRSTGLKISHTVVVWITSIQNLNQKFFAKFKKVKPTTILVTAIVLVLIVTVSIYKRTDSSHNTISTGEVTAKISESKGYLDKASELKLSNLDSARNYLEKANEIIVLLPADSTEVKNLLAQYYQLLSDVNQATLISPSVSANVSDKTKWFGAVGQYIFAADTDGTKITRQIIGKDATDTIFTTSNKAKITYFLFSDSTRQIFVATSDNKLQLILTDNNNQIIQLTLPSGSAQPKIKAATWYQQNLYILEDETGQIWKYTGTTSYKFTAASAYLAKSSLSDKTAIDITNDGNVYLLFSSGNISKFSKGNSVGFGPIQIPKPNSALQSPARIFTDSSSSSIYIQDKNRIIEASKDGQYVGQYFTNLGEIKQSYVSPKSKRGWILTGSKIYQFDL